MPTRQDVNGSTITPIPSASIGIAPPATLNTLLHVDNGEGGGDAARERGDDVTANPALSQSVLVSTHVEAEDAEQDERSGHMLNPLGLPLYTHPARGRGVFAPRTIPAGTLLEESPVLVLTKEEWERGRLDDGVLGGYGFNWSNGGMAIGLGMASMFNHSSSPNVNFVRDPSAGVIRFTTSRRVQPGEELCICYSADESKLWFSNTEQKRSHAATTPENEGEAVRFPALDEEDLVDPEDMAERARRAAERAARLERLREVEREVRGGGRTRRIERFTQKLKREEQTRESGFDPQSRSSTPGSSASGSGGSSGSGRDGGGGGGARGMLPALPERTFKEEALPQPLHSGAAQGGSTRGGEEPEVTVPEDLAWREDNWDSKGIYKGSEAGLGGHDAENGLKMKRVKGPAEREEDAEEEGTMDVWVAEVSEPKLTKQVLNFLKDCIQVDPTLRHLKRVARRPFPSLTANPGAPAPERTLIALCRADSLTLDSLRSALSTYHPSLSVLQPFAYPVPRTPARSPQDFKARGQLWPVVFSPAPLRPALSAGWAPAKLAWVRAGLQRVVDLALLAQTTRGDLPIAVYCTAPPASMLLQDSPDVIPPTPGLRAAASDTRRSAAHPLRHATLNCIASIATLRTRPPFSEIVPERNGADYLLTSLTLFATHEPCVMCCMALLHSRVREVFYVRGRERGGGFEGCQGRWGVMGRKELNHRFEVWRVDGDLGLRGAEQLELGDDVEV